MGAYSQASDLGKVMKDFAAKNNKMPYDGAVVASTARKWLLK
jgi:hypothetical protein